MESWSDGGMEYWKDGISIRTPYGRWNGGILEGYK